MTPRPTQPVDRSGCPAPKHGTENAYSNFKCRCDDGRLAHARYEKRRRNRIGYRPGYIDPLGTQRRLQALAALGHHPEQIAERTGVHRTTIVKLRAGRTDRTTARRRVRRDVADTVDRVYRELMWTIGEHNRTRLLARRHGWAPPLAWDEIDDPTERPKMGKHRPGVERVSHTDDVARLTRAGRSAEQVAEALGISPRTVERTRRRINAAARQAVAAQDDARDEQAGAA